MDFIALYGEAGMIGVVGAMFVYLVMQMSKKATQQQEVLESLKVENRGQSETLENLESICIKLIKTEIKCEYLNFLPWFSSLYLFISGISKKFDTANNIAIPKIK